MELLITDNVEYLKSADELLYQVLWEPFGMPRETRSKFKVEGKEYTFVAVKEHVVVGTFILIIQEQRSEIRHAAVCSLLQGRGIGQSLCGQLLEFAKEQGVKMVEVYGRNTAISFWESLGFQDTSGWLDHEVFKPYGIRFKKLAKQL